jgi:hypothetical protein
VRETNKIRIKQNLKFERHARNKITIQPIIRLWKDNAYTVSCCAVLPNLRKQISFTCLLSILKVSQTQHGFCFILATLWKLWQAAWSHTAVNFSSLLIEWLIHFFCLDFISFSVTYSPELHSVKFWRGCR